MDFFSSYAVAIAGAAVFVFVVSSVVHMASPLHKTDHAGLPEEAAVLDAMREHQVAPGSYMFPFCNSMKAMGSDEMMKKYQRGPVGWLTVMPPGPPAIGKSLGGWFLFSLMISFVIAYLADMTISGPAERELVFRFTATAGTLAYGLSVFPETIWKGQRFGVSLKFVFDGLLYGLATGYAFELLWPS